MPSINNIEKFAEILNSLGDEPAKLEKRGEILEKAKVPPKIPKEENPFLVNPVDDDMEVPNLLDDFDDFDVPLEVDDFEDIPHIDQVPDLEEDSDFDPFSSELEPSGIIEPEDFDSLGMDDITEDDNNLDSLEELDTLDEFEEPEDSLFNLDDLSDLTDTSNTLETQDPFMDMDDRSSYLDTKDEPEELGILNRIDDIDDLIADGSNDLKIQEIDIDDIGGFSDEVEEIDDIDDIEEPGDFFDQEKSFEDEVLEDDFGSLDDEDTDEFSLGDFGDTFNLDEDNSSLLALDELSEEKIEEEAEIEELKITPEEFESLKNTLIGLPLNIKMAIEEEIAENGLFGKRLEELAYLLIDGASAKEIVKYLNKKLGHKLKISPFYAKVTAEELEARKKRFSYIFINKVLPKIKWVIPISLGASLLFLLGYFFGYKIIKSENIYKEGHELILIDKYEEAYEQFLLAFNTHRKTKWYYIYADTYLSRKAFDYAEIIYLQIINENSKELRAVLSYANMLAFEKSEYERAVNFLIEQSYLFPQNYSIMVSLADVYIKWGEIDKRRLQDARLWYNEVLSAFGAKAPILYRLLNCFILLDDYKEVDRIRRILELNPKIKVDGDIFARMAGYLIDKGTIKNIRESLFFALKDNEYNPNLHFQLARYFNSIGDSIEEEKALRKALFYYDLGGKLTKEEYYNLIDANTMLGRLYLNKKDYLASQRYSSMAASMYENLLDRNLIKATSKYGEIYSNYGQVFYYGLNSYDTAYSLFKKAEDNLFSTRELSYRKGYIKYEQNDLDKAIIEIHKSEISREDNIPVMFSKANTLSLRGSYYSAISYYDNLIRLLTKMENEYDTLYPRDNDTHLSIIENYIRVYNNRGVTLYNLHGNRALSEVGFNFTKSMEYYDYLSRDPDFLIRSDIRDLAYHNSRAVTYPDLNTELFLYMDIPKDFSDLNNGLLARLSNLRE